MGTKSTEGGTLTDVMAEKKREARELDRLMALGLSEKDAVARMQSDKELKEALKGVKAVEEGPALPAFKGGRPATVEKTKKK